MSSAGERVLEYLRSIYPRSGGSDDPETQIWLVATPGDNARDGGMRSGVLQLPVFDGEDVTEFVAENHGRRNLYYKAARFDLDAPGPRIVSTRAFHFVWLDLDLAPKPLVAAPRYIDMAVDALDDLDHKPSVIVSTGGGVQALWHFPTPVLIGTAVGSLPAHVFIEQLNHELARVFAGDPAVCQLAGGLRLPFTANMNRSSVCGAGGGPATAKVLRLEPERTCTPRELLEELAGFGTKLSRTRDGHWSAVSAALSKAERVHAAAARAGAMVAGADGKPAKSDAEWAEIKRAMVIKGGRNVAATQFAGWLIRHGLSEDEAVANMIARSTEAAQAVRAGGGTAQPLGRGVLTGIVRSLMKTRERAGQ